MKGLGTFLLFFICAMLVLLLELSWLAQAMDTTSKRFEAASQRSACWDEERGRELPPLLGDDC